MVHLGRGSRAAWCSPRPTADAQAPDHEVILNSPLHHAVVIDREVVEAELRMAAKEGRGADTIRASFRGLFANHGPLVS